MTVIGTNVAALRAASASNSASSMLQTAQNRLSTGKRINSARDDAAGLAIATSMQSQITGMNQGIRNANDGISMAQTAEGSLDEVTNMLQRMRELKVQSANGTYGDDDIKNMTTEQDALASQINSIVTNTQFNGKTLFDGSAGDKGAVVIQAGANQKDTVTLTLTDLTKDTALQTVMAGGKSSADATLSDYDDAIKSVGTTRAGLGATENQLSSAVNNLTTNSTNLSDAQSRIQDADFSAESTNLAKAQILSQASTAMLAQANQSASSVMSLLR